MYIKQLLIHLKLSHWVFHRQVSFPLSPNLLKMHPQWTESQPVHFWTGEQQQLLFGLELTSRTWVTKQQGQLPGWFRRPVSSWADTLWSPLQIHAGCWHHPAASWAGPHRTRRQSWNRRPSPVSLSARAKTTQLLSCQPKKKRHPSRVLSLGTKFQTKMMAQICARQCFLYQKGGKYSMPRIREMVKSIKIHPFTGMLHSYKNV